MGTPVRAASDREGRLRLAVVLAAGVMALVLLATEIVLPALRPGTIWQSMAGWDRFMILMIYLGPPLGLYLGSCVLLLRRRDAGALALAFPLVLLLAVPLPLALSVLEAGTYPARWRGVLYPWLPALAGPTLLAVTAWVAIVRRAASAAPAGGPAVRRCPACGTVQGTTAADGEAGRCELCGFDLPAATAGPAPRPAGWPWGHISVVLVAVAAVAGVPGTLFLHKGAQVHSLAGLGDMLLGLLLLAVTMLFGLVGFIAACEGARRAAAGGPESVRWSGAGLVLLLLLPVGLLALWVAAEKTTAARAPANPGAVPPPVPGGPPPGNRATMKATSVTPPPFVPPPPEMTLEVAAAKVARAGELLRQGRPAEAESLVYLAVVFLDRTAPGEEATWEARQVLAEALLRQRKYRFAEDVLRRGERELRSVGGPLPPAWEARRAVLLDQLAETCQATGRPDEAARLRTERGRPTWELAPPPREVP